MLKPFRLIKQISRLVHNYPSFKHCTAKELEFSGSTHNLLNIPPNVFETKSIIQISDYFGIVESNHRLYCHRQMVWFT
ncbi:unnamed protein product [Heterobilharzia americana]|nr:unnamed protein product [Heterobilharzia americana]